MQATIKNPDADDKNFRWFYSSNFPISTLNPFTGIFSVVGFSVNNPGTHWYYTIWGGPYREKDTGVTINHDQFYIQATGPNSYLETIDINYIIIASM